MISNAQVQGFSLTVNPRVWNVVMYSAYYINWRQLIFQHHFNEEESHSQPYENTSLLIAQYSVLCWFPY